MRPAVRDAQLRELGSPFGWKGMQMAAASGVRLAEHLKLPQDVIERARRTNTNNGRSGDFARPRKESRRVRLGRPDGVGQTLRATPSRRRPTTTAAPSARVWIDERSFRETASVVASWASHLDAYPSLHTCLVNPMKSLVWYPNFQPLPNLTKVTVRLERFAVAQVERPSLMHWSTSCRG